MYALSEVPGRPRGRTLEAQLTDKPYEFLLDEPHRWSSWAAPKKDDGSFDHDRALTGDDLTDFVNGDLFPYLKGFVEALGNVTEVREMFVGFQEHLYARAEVE